MARLRGAVVGLVCAGAAVAAHSTGGGELPSSASLVLLVCFGATIGLFAAHRTGRLPVLVAQLWLGQLIAHLLLTGMTPHCHISALAVPMVMAHTVTAVAVGLGLWSAERLVALVVSSMRRWVDRVLALPPEPGARRVPVFHGTTALREFLLTGGPPGRGPPLVVAAA